MAAITICCDFWSPWNKVCPYFHCFPICLPRSDGPDAMILIFWMLNFKPTFSLSSFTFIKRLFSSSLLSAIRMVSSAYLRLLIFLLSVLIPACASFNQLEHLEVHSSHIAEVWLGEFWALLASLWDKCNLALPFFGIGMRTDLFQSCGHCWLLQICSHIVCGTFTASSFRIWNSSSGIPSPPLAVFIVILPKDHLTSHSTMFGSRWVITPLWLSGSWRSVFV